MPPEPLAAPAIPPAPPAPLSPPIPPAPPASIGGAGTTHGDTHARFTGANHQHVDITTDTDAQTGFALVTTRSFECNGTPTDCRQAKRLSSSDKPLLWFRRGTQAYTLDNADAIRQAKTALAPLDTLAKKQSKLAAQQGELVGRQSGLVARQVDLAARQSRLAGKRAGLNGHSQNFAARQADLQRRQTALDVQQQSLSRDQSTLGDQQTVLGKRQSALGQRQQRAEKQVAVQLDKILDKAIANGSARKISMR